MKTIISLFVFASLFTACEHKPTAEEIRAQQLYQQHIADSVKQHYIMVNRTRDSLENVLIKYKGDLEAQQTRLNDVKGFQFLRTASEKEQQISQAKQNCEILEHNIQVVETEMQRLQ